MKLEPWAENAINNLPANRRRTVRGFLQALEDEGVGAARGASYVGAIRTLGGNGGGAYVKFTEGDLRAWAKTIDEHYKPRSARLYKIGVKRFLKWIHTNDLNGGKCPKCISWLKPKRCKRNYGRGVLSMSEVKSLIGAADGQRDRALLFVAYESGPRASEIVSPRIKDVSFDQHGAVLRLDGKTGERRVRLFESVPDLQLWLSMHPDKDNPEAFLWPSGKFKGQHLHRKSFLTLVWKYAKKAGLNKKISPHSFRHARATHLATVLKEAQMREFFGWSKDSDMPSIYVHLSGRDVDQSLFEHYGIKKREDGSEESPLKKKVCLRCNIENSVSARFCWRCWAAFDTAKSEELTAKALEALMGMVDPAQFREKLKKMGLDQEIKKLAQGG